MTGAAAGFERRVHDALEASPSRIPVVLGGCGTGRTWLLQHLYSRVGSDRVQYIAVERCATTPERFLHAVTAASPFAGARPAAEPGNARQAFEALIAFFDAARAPDGGPALFLLDEVLELRTFESFPGLRHVIRELVDAMAASPNQFVLTTRYVARTHRLLRDAPARFEVMHVPPLEAGDIVEQLAPVFDGYERMATDDRDYLGRAVQALAAGRPVYVKAIGDALAQQAGVRQGGMPDPVAALATLLAPDGSLTAWCRFCYELRLHRARGYGALKAILDILAEEESLTLTEISQRLHRTPGSTKDYLSWLEDVDLVVARQKRYSYTDPVLRLWNRLHCRSAEPTQAEIARAVQLYALSRVPLRDTVPALAYAGVEATPEERKSWGIIEID